MNVRIVMHHPTERNKLGWYGDHVWSYQIITKKQAEVVLLGDSLVANMSQYPIVWDHHLENLNVVNCGIRGDHTQNVLWQVDHNLPATVSVGLIHCRINDINSTSTNAYRPNEIAENVILCGFKLRERHPLMSIIIIGILPAEETIWGRKSQVEQVNCLLKEFCSSHGFLFVEPAGC